MFISKFVQLPKEAKIFVVLKLFEAFAGAWVYPVYVLFLLSHGLTLEESNWCNFVYMLILTVTDPFTGNLGDRKGHINVYRLGVRISAVATLFYGMSTSFLFFLVAEGIHAIAAASISEALETWMRNRVTNEHSKNAKAFVGGMQAYVTAIPFVTSSLISAALGFTAVWIISATLKVALLILTFFLIPKGRGDKFELNSEDGVPSGSVNEVSDDNRKSNLDGGNSDVFDAITVWEGVILLVRSPYLLIPTIVSFFLTFSFQGINMFWSANLEPIVGEKYLGVIFALMMFAISRGQAVLLHIQTKHISLTSLGWATVSIGILLGNATILLSYNEQLALIIGMKSFGNGYFSLNSLFLFLGIALFILHEFPRGLFNGMLSVYLDEDHEDNPINSSNRATIKSIRSAIGTLGAMFGLLGSGYASRSLDINEIWILTSIFIISLGIITLLFKKLKS